MKNEGRGRARSRALSLARGEWSVVLDMDDFCFPDRLSRAVEARLQGFDFMCSAMALIDHNYAVHGVRGARWHGYPRSFPHATVCGRTELLRAIGYPGYRQAEDQTMVLTLANTHRGHYCEEPLYVYHENANANLRNAFAGHHCISNQLRDLGRHGVLRPPAIVRGMRARCYLKMAALLPFFVCPPLYRQTLRWRANDAAGAGSLASDRLEFIELCAERYPLT